MFDEQTRNALVKLQKLLISWGEKTDKADAKADQLCVHSQANALAEEWFDSGRMSRRPGEPMEPPAGSVQVRVNSIADIHRDAAANRLQHVLRMVIEEFDPNHCGEDHIPQVPAIVKRELKRQLD